MTTIPKYSAEHQSVRDTLLGEAVRAGKILPSRTQYWSQQFDADPEGTKAILAQLASAPGIAANAQGAAPTSPADVDYDQRWLTPAERARVQSGGNHRLVTHGQD